MLNGQAQRQNLPRGTSHILASSSHAPDRLGPHSECRGLARATTGPSVIVLSSPLEANLRLQERLVLRPDKSQQGQIVLQTLTVSPPADESLRRR